ncbi:Gfo/Idh/MocA family protein [Cohnella hongkongensis]|uniref:Gfo/Idh/MocA family protein n=1 Tax=Cohnella hongkongensis TaxID=178337 RepID=A0ABV9F6I1_9BACL
MAKTFKVAVLGAGDMGKYHIHGWTLAGHEVVSITELDLETAKKAAEAVGLSGVSYYQDYKQAVADPEADIVSIALPLPFHAPAAILAAQHGKHVFCEKPLAGSLEDARQMQEAVEKAGVQFGIGFQRNFAHGVELVKEWVREDKFGRPTVISSDLLQEVRPKRVMHDKLGNQGPVVDTLCHYLLMWQTIFDSKPVRVSASGGVYAAGRPEISHFKQLAVDTAVVIVEYASGDIGTMTISWCLAKDTQMRPRPDRIFGPKGGAEGAFNTFGRDAGKAITLYVGDRVESARLEERELFQIELGKFADAIASGQPAPVSFATGTDMLKLSYAVLDAIETGKTIEL